MRLTLAAACVAALGGCSLVSNSFEWRRVSLGGRPSQCLPVAFTLPAQERGLQGVKRVVRPMVFAYSPPGKPSFWMKDTPSPLTGVWVGAGHHVIGYWYGRPESAALHPPPAPVSAVIEYSQGMSVPPLGASYILGPKCRSQPGGL